jgi:hypothetical protein
MENENTVHGYTTDDGEMVSPLDQAIRDLELFETEVDSLESFEAWVWEH